MGCEGLEKTGKSTFKTVGFKDLRFQQMAEI